MQVGLVTLISVSQSPITSRPANSRPFPRSTGPTSAQIARSRSDSGTPTPRPPAARLPRVSPGAGVRASAEGGRSEERRGGGEGRGRGGAGGGAWSRGVSSPAAGAGRRPPPPPPAGGEIAAGFARRRDARERVGD